MVNGLIVDSLITIMMSLMLSANNAFKVESNKFWLVWLAQVIKVDELLKGGCYGIGSGRSRDPTRFYR